MSSSNKHLKTKISEIRNFTNAHNNPPKDLYHSFLLELKVSKLYLPAEFEGEEVNFDHLESDDGMQLLPLYTSPEEYRGEKDLKNYGFPFFAEIIADCDFDGCVINPDTEEIFVERSFTDVFRVKAKPAVDDDEIYDAFELKEIAHTVKNEALVSFIRNDSNFNRFDDLIRVLSGSVLLNVVSSHADLSNLANDGILSTLEVGGFNLSVKSEGMNKYGLLFTDLGAIRDTCDRDAGIHYYCQVTSFDKILGFILTNDLDGLIINPGIDDYHVPRNVLLDIYENHPEIMENPKYLSATFYAFTF